MSQARCNRRRRKQAAQGFTHLHVTQRPKYRRRQLLNVQAAIAWEKQKAAKQAKAQAGKKKQ